MSDNKAPPGSPTDAARRERLRAALRENLKRRKAQAKARAGQGRSDSARPHGAPADAEE